MTSGTQPRMVMAALKGGSGKTILTLGLIAVWREMGYRVAPFKKGPDFIDAGWLTFAADRPCHNLDPFLMQEDQIVQSFLSRSEGADVSLIEGNRGLYDGLDIDGCCSTAELAKLLDSPVILILDVSMATRTIAAIVKGCQVFDPNLHIKAVILNRVAGPRQQSLVTKAVEKYCGLPVVGTVPKLKGGLFPERHMGLVPYQERDHSEKAVRWARDAVRKHLRHDLILDLARQADPLEAVPAGRPSPESPPIPDNGPRIGYILDRSFWFYYPENLEQLQELGATLVRVDAISDRALPRLDALYIGGGFPETQAQALAENRNFRHSLKAAVAQGLPVYAECGGLMYLGESLIVGENHYPMVGALPVQLILEKKPQGHGYTILKVDRSNPFYPVGETLLGHEFHYSRAILTGSEAVHYAFGVTRGHGVDGKRDGIVRKNLLATYTHVHAGGNRTWARALFDAALKRKRSEVSSSPLS